MKDPKKEEERMKNPSFYKEKFVEINLKKENLGPVENVMKYGIPLWYVGISLTLLNV